MPHPQVAEGESLWGNQNVFPCKISSFSIKKKSYDYKEINSVEYNEGYNEKHPIIDTIIPYYKDAQPIFVRSGFNIGGHTGIGSINGGSLVLFICNSDCLKCIEN